MTCFNQLTSFKALPTKTDKSLLLLTHSLRITQRSKQVATTSQRLETEQDVLGRSNRISCGHIRRMPNV